MRNRELIRTWRLIALLRSGPGCTLDRLSRELGVHQRTIRRDLDALQEAGLAVYDLKPDDVRMWRLVKGSPCPICGRAPITSTALRRVLTATLGGA